MTKKIVKFYKAKDLRILFDAMGTDSKKVNDYLNIDVLLPKDVNSMLQQFGYDFTIDELIEDIDVERLHLTSIEKNGQFRAPEHVVDKVQRNLNGINQRKKDAYQREMNALEEKRLEEQRRLELEERKKQEQEELERIRQEAEARRIEHERLSALKEKENLEKIALLEKQKIEEEKNRIKGLTSSQQILRSNEMLQLDRKDHFEKDEEAEKARHEKRIKKEEERLVKAQQKQQKIDAKIALKEKKEAAKQQKIKEANDRRELALQLKAQQVQIAKEQKELAKAKKSEVVKVEKPKKLNEKDVKAIVLKEQVEERASLTENKITTNVEAKVHNEFNKEVIKEVEKIVHKQQKAEAIIKPTLPLEFAEDKQLTEERKANAIEKAEAQKEISKLNKEAIEVDTELFAYLAKIDAKEKAKARRIERNNKFAQDKLMAAKKKEELRAVKEKAKEKRILDKEFEQLRILAAKKEIEDKILDEKLIEELDSALRHEEEVKRRIDQKEYSEEVHQNEKVSTVLIKEIEETDEIVEQEEMIPVDEEHIITIDSNEFVDDELLEQVIPTVEEIIDEDIKTEVNSIKLEKLESKRIISWQDKLKLRRYAKDLKNRRKSASRILKTKLKEHKSMERIQIVKDKAERVRKYESLKARLSADQIQNLRDQKLYRENTVKRLEEETLRQRILHAQIKEQSRIREKEKNTREKLANIKLKDAVKEYRRIESERIEAEAKDEVYRKYLAKREAVKQKALDLAFKEATKENNRIDQLSLKQQIAHDKELKAIADREAKLLLELAVAKRKEHEQHLKEEQRLQAIADKETLRLIKEENERLQKEVEAKILEAKKIEDAKLLQLKKEEELKNRLLSKAHQVMDANEKAKLRMQQEEEMKKIKLEAQLKKIHSKVTSVEDKKQTASIKKQQRLARKRIEEKIMLIEKESNDIFVSNSDFVSNPSTDVLAKRSGRQAELKKLDKTIKKEEKTANSIRNKIQVLRDKDLERKAKLAAESDKLNEDVELRNHKRLKELEKLKEEENRLSEESVRIEKKLKSFVKTEINQLRQQEEHAIKNSKTLASAGHSIRKEEMEIQKVAIEKRLEAVKSRAERANLEYELLKDKLAKKEDKRSKRNVKRSKEVNVEELKFNAVIPKHNIKKKNADVRKVEKFSFADEIKQRKLETEKRVEELKHKHKALRVQRTEDLKLELEKAEARNIEQKMHLESNIINHLNEQENDKKVTESIFKQREAKLNAKIRQELKDLALLEKKELQELKRKAANMTKQEVRMEIQNIKQKIRLQRLRIKSKSVRKELDNKIVYTEIE